MKKILVNMLITGSKLCLFCALSAIALSLLNSVTYPQIVANREKQEKLALAELISEGIPGEKKQTDDDIVISYYPVNSKNTVVSYVLELSGSGYGGVMKIMAHYKSDGELLSAKLMDNKETPGLGKKAEAPGYMKKFIGKGGAGRRIIPTTSAELISQMESPGRIDSDPTLPSGFEGTLTTVVQWVFGKPKSGSGDSITGATITFKGVSKALAAGSLYIQSHFRGLK